MLTNGSWQDMWHSWRDAWNSASGVQFPKLDSSNEQWRQAVLAEPVKLMQLLQKFPYQHTLLNALSDEVLVAWTAAWRQDCVYQGLMAYRHRTPDQSTQVWLDEWKARTISLSGTSFLASVLDSTDDWTKLRERGYGSDKLLRRCEVTYKSRFAWHTICAILHNVDIKALTGLPVEADDSVPDKIRRHLEAYKSHVEYRRAFQDASQLQDWSVLPAFFATSLAHESVTRTLQY